MTVADRIKDLRIKQGLSQEDLAKKMGLKNRSSVTQVEKSGNDITLHKVEKFAEALGVSPAYLMGWNIPRHDIVVFDDSGKEFIIELEKLTKDFDKKQIDRLLSYARFIGTEKEGGD